MKLKRDVSFKSFHKHSYACTRCIPMTPTQILCKIALILETFLFDMKDRTLKIDPSTKGAFQNFFLFVTFTFSKKLIKPNSVEKKLELLT